MQFCSLPGHWKLSGIIVLDALSRKRQQLANADKMMHVSAVGVKEKSPPTKEILIHEQGI